MIRGRSYLLVALLGAVSAPGCGQEDARSPGSVSTGGAAGAPLTAGGQPSAGAAGAPAAGGHVATGGQGPGGATPLASGGSSGAPAITAGQGGGGASGAATGGTGPGAGGAMASGGTASASGGSAGANAATLPPVTSTDVAGPFMTSQDLATGPRGKSGLFRPSELGKNGLKHPLFVWGCGGMSTPSSYANELNRIASHGFVVLAEVSTIGDNGAPLKAAIDWLISENDRAQGILYQKLDTTKIGLGGHSIGSVNAFIVAPDPRLTTSIHVAGGSLDDVNNPSGPTTGQGGKKLTHPAAYICSENDIFGNVAKTQADYDQTTVPVFFTIISGADHVGATQAGLPAIIAWLRWQLGGESARRSSFLDPQGDFCTGKFVSKSKNF